MDIESLLVLLSDGEYHSGSELGEKLGVSRAAIWKSLARLSEFNLEVESVKGKGYRLPHSLDLLSTANIARHLSESVLEQVELSHYFSVDSTNRCVSEKLTELTRPYLAATSEMQTGGRGRRGRSWESPFAKNIYLSMGFELEGGVEALSGLSLVVGVAAVRAIKSCCAGLAVGLKWPNDLWIEDKKLAGILVELQGEATSGWRVVVGIGVNVLMNKEDLIGEIDQPWASLSEYAVCDRNELAAGLIEQIVVVLTEYREKGFDAFMEEWSGYDCLRGRLVYDGSGSKLGLVKGVDVSGALKVEDEGVERLVNAGEISVRPMSA